MAELNFEYHKNFTLLGKTLQLVIFTYIPIKWHAMMCTTQKRTSKKHCLDFLSSLAWGHNNTGAACDFKADKCNGSSAWRWPCFTLLNKDTSPESQTEGCSSQFPARQYQNIFEQLLCLLGWAKYATRSKQIFYQIFSYCFINVCSMMPVKVVEEPKDINSDLWSQPKHLLFRNWQKKSCFLSFSCFSRVFLFVRLFLRMLLNSWSRDTE